MGATALAKSRDQIPTHSVANGLAPGTIHQTTTTDARAPFDLDRGRFALSPRMAWSLLGAACIIGAGVAAMHFRIGGVESTIVDLRSEIQEDRANTQTRQQAYIDCLETERTNPGWRCPLAKGEPSRTIPVRTTSKQRTSKVAKETQQPSLFAWPFPVTPALAKGK